MPFGSDVRHGEGEDSKNPIQHIHDREVRCRGVVKGLRGSKVWPSQHRSQVFIPFDPEGAVQLKRPRTAWISISSFLTSPGRKFHDQIATGAATDEPGSVFLGPLCIGIGLSDSQTRSRCTGAEIIIVACDATGGELSSAVDEIGSLRSWPDERRAPRMYICVSRAIRSSEGARGVRLCKKTERSNRGRYPLIRPDTELPTPESHKPNNLLPSPYPSKLYCARNEFGTATPITRTGSGILPAPPISKIHDES